MNDNRPLHKRAKFVAFAMALLVAVTAMIANVVSQALGGADAVDPGTMAILASAIPIGLPFFQMAQGKVDATKAGAPPQAPPVPAIRRTDDLPRVES